ncbi:unnamed protein product [Staurois parvus]|uniref:Uncharacterized protein n=1 Tax=Staurois parvus TaxID=386267 RepID=A0ABN9AMS4_9NEOB|nr:unnamed protein product [Staurois parvus]
MRKGIIFTKIIALPCSMYCGRLDIVYAGSGESGYSECGVRGERI